MIKSFTKYILTLVAILMVTSNAWAQAQNLQYQWVERFSGTTTFDNADLKKITDGEYTNNVKFSISDVSYYYNDKWIGNDDYLLKYAKQSKNSTKTSTFSWTAKDNTYNIIVTKIEAYIRGYQAKISTKTASAYFTNGETINCNTNSTGEEGSKNISVTNNSGLGNSTTLTMTTGENDTEFTLHNIRYTYRVTQRVPDFQYKAIALTNNSEYGSAYSSWTSFANATNSESSHSAYNKDILSASNGLGQKVYFKAVPKAGYNFVGWKESLDATTYKSYEEEYSFDFTSTSNDKNAPTTITLYAIFEAQKDPRFTIPATATAKVDETKEVGFIFDDVASVPVDYDVNLNADFTFKITHTPDNTTKADSPDSTKVISYDPTTNRITALNSGTAIITFAHKQTDTYIAKSATCTITVSKCQTQFSHSLSSTYYVGDWANLADVYSKSDNDLDVTFSTTDANVVSVSDGKIIAQNKGEATITITQPENYKWTSVNQTVKLTIKKHTPVFNVTSETVNYNRNQTNGKEYADFVYVTCSEHTGGHSYDTDLYADVELTSYTTSNPVAELRVGSTNSKLNLSTFNNESVKSITLTIEQKETRYWEYKKQDVTINLANESNHVKFTITDANHTIFEETLSNEARWQNNGYRLGNGRWIAREDEVVISFTGIPDTLYFDKVLEKSVGQLPGTHLCRVYESVDGNGWKQVWERDEREENYKGIVPLSPTTRFIKFYYNGTVYCNYRNIHVTELNEFRAVDGEEKDVETINLGTENQVGTHTTANFNFKYANAGYKVKFEIVGANDAATTEARKYITLSHASLQTINGEQYITNIGGEKYGTVENIQVDLYTEKEEYVIPDGTIIRITDETGIHLETIKLTGSILRSDQELYWQELFLKDPVILPLTVGTITDIAKSSRDLVVTYESSDTEVINISDDGKSLIPLKEGEVIITAKQEGNYLFNPATPISKPVIVTGKTVQVIICTDDLSDLVQGSAPIELSAKVYIIDLENQGKLQYNEEQTANLQYEVSDPSVASLEGNVLTPIELGTATLTITVPGNETYKEDKITVPIRVRPATAGCEDILLVNHRESQEFFALNITRPEVISKIDTIDLSKGIPGTLDFQYSGKPWTLAIEYYGGEIVAEQSIDGKNWSEIITITPTKNQTESSVDNKLDRNAKYIRFRRPQGGIGYHYVSNIKVYPAQYIETNKTIIDYGQIHIGTQQEFTFNVNYSNIKHELSPKIYLAPDQIATDVVLSQPTQPFGYCGAFGTQTVSGIWTPKTGGLSTERSIVFTDAITGLSATVVLKADVLKKTQHIIWDDAPTTIDDYTDINSRPAKTKNDLNEDVLDITYEVVEGKDYAFFEDGVFYIKGTGDIVIRAYNDGNFEYEAVEERFTINITGMPPTFVGGGSDNKWTNIENWVNKIYPEKPEKYAVILADAVIDESIQINQLLVSDEGSVHITSTGGLTVGEGGIQCSKTDGSAIVIDNLKTGAGFLRINPEYKGTMPRITMRYETRSTLDSGANKDATWQYIGAPGLNSTIYVDYNTWLYKLDEPNKNWVLQPRVDSVSLDPFEGYAITQYGKPTYEWTADMTTKNCTIPLTYSKNGRSGRHIIANSYTAPINVAAFNGDEFQFLDGMNTKYRIEKTLYIFNSGSWKNWNTAGQTATGSSAGQYYAIPVKAAAAQYMTEDIGEQTTIAPMQGIYLRVRSLTPLDELPEAGEQVGNLVLDYKQLVMGSDHEMHRPMRAPQRTTSSAMQDPNFRRVRIVATSENSGADRVYIIQDNINTRKYNNGYDATNQEAKGLVNIYTNETGGKMEVSCSNNIDSMYIGFMAGSDHTYTLHFSAIIGDILYLQDLDNGQKISIVEGGSYTFEAEPQSTNHKRFLLLTSQGVSTGTDEVALANIWYSNKALHITNAPNNSTLTLYDISGHQLLSTTIQETPYTLDLSHLTEGIYIARLNNQVYKFVCK